MRLLLDTHVWLWSRLDASKLGPKLASKLRDSANELWISPISVWEALIILERGRVEVEGNPTDWIRNALRSGPLRDAPLTREVALKSRALTLEHQDPADRFIAASAAVHQLTLATSDRRLLAGVDYDTIGNQ